MWCSVGRIANDARLLLAAEKMKNFKRYEFSGRTGDYTMKDIAGHFDVHYSTVSRAIKKAEDM
jgi:DNA-binding MarR family transcriptional regulator